MQGFYFFVKFGLVLIYTRKVYRKKSSSIVQCSIDYFHFSFEKHVLSQVLKDFSAEILETTPRSIYLELLIIGVVFNIIHNVRSVQFGLFPIRIFFLSVFLSFFLLFFFFFRYFLLQATCPLTVSQNK